MTGSPDWWLIANPENRRVALFQEALQQAGLAPARVLPYRALLDDGWPLLAGIAAGSVLRIESPGEDFEVERRILALGGVAQAMQLPDEHGRIWHPGAWFQGFSQLMTRIGQGVGAVRWFNHPDDIVAMFDKPRSKRLLAPHALAPLPSFTCYTDFLAYVRRQACPRYFIKLAYSSSASGVMAYAYHRGRDVEHAYSTVERVIAPEGVRYFNSLKVRAYRERDSISAILDFLFAQGAVVEPWIPKARHGDFVYDLRVVGIAGRRQHVVARLSRSPMTNLHLGNRRGDVAALGLTALQWQGIDEAVEASLRAYPRALYAGLDILLPREGGAPVVLEANAFGDLLPNLRHQGRSTYLAEILALCAREGIAHAPV